MRDTAEERAVSLAPSPKIADTKSKSSRPTKPQFRPPMIRRTSVTMSKMRNGSLLCKPDPHNCTPAVWFRPLMLLTNALDHVTAFNRSGSHRAMKGRRLFSSSLPSRGTAYKSKQTRMNPVGRRLTDLASPGAFDAVAAPSAFSLGPHPGGTAAHPRRPLLNPAGSWHLDASAAFTGKAVGRACCSPSVHDE
jgi:hypothetical protein